MERQTALHPRLSKTCDLCKLRKVRCNIGDGAGSSQACSNCKSRGVECHFSFNKRRVRRAIPFSQETCHATVPSNPTVTPNQVSDASNAVHVHSFSTDGSSRQSHLQASTSEIKFPLLYMDHTLKNKHIEADHADEGLLLKVDRLVLSMMLALEHVILTVISIKTAENRVGSSGIAFFSDKGIASMTARLGNNKLQALFERLIAFANARWGSSTSMSGSAVRLDFPINQSQAVDPELAKSYISAYFEHVQALYPLLDREKFERDAFSPRLDDMLQRSSGFFALYHAILALGCLHLGGGAFEPGKGDAWMLYQKARAKLPTLLLLQERLVSAQAVTAMAIFAQTSSCAQAGNPLITEAAKITQFLGYNKGINHGESAADCNRTFWVTYMMEKASSFACGRSSILMDYDVGANLPETPETLHVGFDWFLTMVRFARLLSRTYEALFSVNATLDSPEKSLEIIGYFDGELEQWRLSIPAQIRPGKDSDLGQIITVPYLSVALRMHYHYYSLVIALSRLKLQKAEAHSSLFLHGRTALIEAACTVVQSTKYILAEASTPLWIMVSMPLSAIFILFDFIVRNPDCPDTKQCLSLLGVGAGYFCRLEYASAGFLPGSIIYGFFDIANQYMTCNAASESSTQPAGHHDRCEATPDSSHSYESQAAQAFNDNAGSSLSDLFYLESLFCGNDNLQFPPDIGQFDQNNVMDHM